MRKRTLSLILAGLFVFGASACSDDSADDGTGDSTVDDGADSGTEETTTTVAG